MRRALLRQVQSAPITRSSLPRVTPFLQSPARWSGQSPRRQVASAWFSSSTESTNNDAAAQSSTSEQPASGETPQDPVKKELEAKNREVIDLKVCGTYFPPIFPCWHWSSFSRTLFANISPLPLGMTRTNTYAPSPTSGTCKSERGGRWNRHDSLRSSASPRI